MSRSWLAFIPFALVVLTLAVGFHLYLYRRLVRGMTDSRRARLVGGLVFAALGALIVVGPAATRLVPREGVQVLGRASYLWWALAFYLFVGMLLVDCGHLVLPRVRALLSRAPEEAPPDPARRAFLVRSARVSASAAAFGVTGFGISEAYEIPRVTEVPVRLPRLPAALSGLTLAHLSDVHAGAWIDRRFLEDLVAATNATRPDAVVITGDLVDGSVADLRPMVAPLSGLRSRYGTFFVTGNHEFYSGAEAWCAELRRMGMTVLRNERAVLGDAGASLDLLGVEDPTGRGQRRGGGLAGVGTDLAACVAGRDPERAAVLLAHQPRSGDVDKAAALGIGLQLSGHTHGGQIWPWSLAVRLAFPYLSGRYHVGDLTLYVSNGCGFWGPPVRVGAPPEIVKVVLG